MIFRQSHEKGSIMVEVIAVLALLGIMGMMLFRQVQRRNEELSNINMASEIRMIKEATTAYIQANKADLEANYCPGIGDDGVETGRLPPRDIEKFLPNNWISDSADDSEDDSEDSTNGIIYEYDIELSCYRINSEAADNRLAMYATIIPTQSAIPQDFSLRRAARVAALIGSDGGVYDNGKLVGTAGAWEIDCGEACNGRDDYFYVATTGMDIYIPETENTADNTVAVPPNIAFENLHSTDYFSVGDGTTNCVNNYDEDHERFAHETLQGTEGVGYAQNDEIRHAGVAGCDPLFWVGTTASADVGDHSTAGQVYVKNNLYIGRENANNQQAIALETGNANADRAITVFDTNGKRKVVLNGNGEVVLFSDIDDDTVPTMILKDGRIETTVNAQYPDDKGETQTKPYAVDPAGESLMNDIRLTSRGGARLSDILPNYILKGTQTIVQSTANQRTTVTKPACPAGYAKAITVTPIRYSQYVKSGSFQLNAPVNNNNSININLNNTTETPNQSGFFNLAVKTHDGKSSLTLMQLPPVKIEVNTNDTGDKWTVKLTYDGWDSAVTNDPITALAQTYCVFEDTTNRDIQHTQPKGAISETGLTIDAAESAGIISSPTTCTSDNDCNGGKCVNGYCHILSCIQNSDCESGKKCVDHQCVDE